MLNITIRFYYSTTQSTQLLLTKPPPLTVQFQWIQNNKGSRGFYPIVIIETCFKALNLDRTETLYYIHYPQRNITVNESDFILKRNDTFVSPLRFPEFFFKKEKFNTAFSVHKPLYINKPIGLIHKW